MNSLKFETNDAVGGDTHSRFIDYVSTISFNDEVVSLKLRSIAL